MNFHIHQLYKSVSLIILINNDFIQKDIPYVLILILINLMTFILTLYQFASIQLMLVAELLVSHLEDNSIFLKFCDTDLPVPLAEVEYVWIVRRHIYDVTQFFSVNKI